MKFSRVVVDIVVQFVFAYVAATSVAEINTCAYLNLKTSQPIVLAENSPLNVSFTFKDNCTTKKTNTTSVIIKAERIRKAGETPQIICTFTLDSNGGCSTSRNCLCPNNSAASSEFWVTEKLEESQNGSWTLRLSSGAQKKEVDIFDYGKFLITPGHKETFVFNDGEDATSAFLVQSPVKPECKELQYKPDMKAPAEDSTDTDESNNNADAAKCVNLPSSILYRCDHLYIHVVINGSAPQWNVEVNLSSRLPRRQGTWRLMIKFQQACSHVDFLLKTGDKANTKRKDGETRKGQNAFQNTADEPNPEDDKRLKQDFRGQVLAVGVSVVTIVAVLVILAVMCRIRKNMRDFENRSTNVFARLLQVYNRSNLYRASNMSLMINNHLYRESGDLPAMSDAVYYYAEPAQVIHEGVGFGPGTTRHCHAPPPPLELEVRQGEVVKDGDGAAGGNHGNHLYVPACEVRRMKTGQGQDHRTGSIVRRHSADSLYVPASQVRRQKRDQTNLKRADSADFALYQNIMVGREPKHPVGEKNDEKNVISTTYVNLMNTNLIEQKQQQE